jgi:hypothetical protein
MKIIVTLTTIPSREDSVIKTIKSLQQNTIKPTDIYVNLRNYIVRLNKSFSPEFENRLLELNVKINYSKDYGSLTKIIPIKYLDLDPDTLIITADDDIIYNEKYIEGLVNGFIEFDQKCIAGYSGIGYPDTSIKILNGQLGYICYQNHGDYTEILESGFGTILKKKWLDKLPDIPEETKNSDKYLYMCDDYFMALYYDKIGIQKRIVNYSNIGRINDDWSSICNFIEESSNNKDSLSNNTSSIQNYYNGMNTIKKYIATNL